MQMHRGSDKYESVTVLEWVEHRMRESVEHMRGPHSGSPYHTYVYKIFNIAGFQKIVRLLLTFYKQIHV